MVGPAEQGSAHHRGSLAGADGKPGALGGLRDYAILCHECGEAARYPEYRCARCDGPLSADLQEVVSSTDVSATGLWRRRGVLPRCDHAVSLGEGDTPLVPLASFAGVRTSGVFAKLETLNPTLSFKDRAMALGASIALDLGLRGLLLGSTGNAAVSAAAYAAAAGLECLVFAGASSSASRKLSIAQSHGAVVRLVEGDYSDAYRKAAESEGPDWLNVTTTYRNPLLAEAYRTIAFELHEQVDGPIDAVVVPIGAGPLLYGLSRGFADLVLSGCVLRAPRLIGVQAENCAPLARAWGHGEWREALGKPYPQRQTVAEAIADALRGYEVEGVLTLEAVRDSGGEVVAVDERGILLARDWLARSCGLSVEPAAAAAVAALSHPSLHALLSVSERVVVMLTGHGAKEEEPEPSVTSSG